MTRHRKGAVKSILITGNMGYVGPGVVSHLRACYPDAVLVGVDTGFFAANLTHVSALPECQLDCQHFVDVRHIPDVLLEGVDSIVHLAAISNDPMGKAFEEVTYAVNHRASVELARRAKAAGVRAFVFASSCSVYGLADDRPKTEQSELDPLTAYARSKVLTEQDLKPLAGDGFSVTCLRFATACGMSNRLRLDLVLNDFVASAVVSKRIEILSDGTPWRPLIHVLDMARAIEWAISRDAAHGGAYLSINAGCDDWNCQVRELADGVAKVIPGVDISVNPDAQPDKRSYRVDFSLFRDLAPDHQPRYSLVAAVEGLKEGLEGMGFRDAEFRGSDFMRLKALSKLRAAGLLNDNLEWVRPA